MRRDNLILLGIGILVALIIGSLQVRAGRHGFIAGMLSRQFLDGNADVARQADPPPYNAIGNTDLPNDGVLSVDDATPLSDFVLTVGVTAPAQAVRMQLADNVAFLGTEWEPVGTQARVRVAATGYQTVFARFELADGSITPLSVAGVEIDPTYGAATSSLDGGHEPSWIRPFSAHELVLRIEAGRFQPGALEAYDLDNLPPGDEMFRRRNDSIVKRDGKGYGLTVSQRRDVIRRVDRLIGKPLDIDPVLSDPWSISSSDDLNYGQPIEPASIRSLARPAGGGIDADGERLWAVTYDLVVSVPTPLTVGATYTITPSGTVGPVTFVYQPQSMISPAVRVTQSGIGTTDQPKVGYLAGWFDGIGSSATADTEPSFSVVETGSGIAVFEGIGQLRPGGNEMDRGDLTGTAVVELDFTAVSAPGRYQLCVEAVGCSYPFEIEDNVWLKLTDTVARAVYHQRSGIELGPPFTPVVRPRPYHPDDGVAVVHSGYSLLEARRSTENTDFQLLADNATEARATEAWGGHFDAGDWDRRVNHLWYVRTAVNLVGHYPETFARRELNIPETGDGVPDLLDEALWSLDLFHRLQTEDGAVSGGIEAAAHPPSNSASWVDDLAVFVYEPDIYSTYIYAGIAAETAAVLELYDPVRAIRYEASAAQAMAWAEAQWSMLADDAVAEFVRPQRNVAAAAMLATTNDQRWHSVFVETADYLLSNSSDISCHSHSQCDAAWLYLQAATETTDPAIRDQLVDMFRSSADEIAAAAQSTTYGWTVENPAVPLIWGLGSGGAPHTNGLLRAYILTGDERYRETAVRSAQVALGANPQNRVLLSGVGYEPVRHPQINDVKHGGLRLWPGVPVYGRHLLNAESDDSWVIDDNLAPAGAVPDPTTIPYLWQWYDVSNVAFFNEFTIHQGEADALWTFGVLAATAGP